MIPGIKNRTFTFHDLVMYLAIAYVHIRLMILLVCLSMLVGMAYFIFSKPVYVARSLVHADALALPVDSDQTFHDSSLGYIATQLGSNSLLERTARQFGIKDNYREITRKYIKKIAVRPTSQTSIEIEVAGYSLSLSRSWAELLVQEFTKARDEERIAYNEMLVKSYKNELSEIGAKIENSFGQKFDFMTKQGMTQALIELDRIKQLPQQMVLLKQRIETMSTVKKKLEDPTLTTVARLSLFARMEKDMEEELRISVGQIVPGDADKEKAQSVVIVPALTNPDTQDESWEKLEMDQRRVQNEIDAASTIYMPGHQKMIALNKDLAEVEKKLELEYQVADAKFELQYQELLNKKADLDAKMPSYQEITKKYEKIKQDFQLQESGQLAWDELYANASKRISAAEFGGEKERVNLQYLGIILSKDEPVSPRFLAVFFASLVFGLVVALGVVFLIEFLDHTISNIEEVEATFQIRGLGIIPQFEGIETQHPILMDSQDGEDKNLLENFRVIRTNILSMGAMSKPPQVIMVTSSVPKEGKTVVSSNLAVSFAQMGAKTLLMDTDMRRGRLHRLFGLRKGPGLSNLLLEKSTIEEALRPSGKENLTVLSSGQHLESGSEHFGSPRFAEIMKDLRSRFDRILVDTPPVLGLSETSILQPHMDGVIFVVWGGRTPIRSMKTAVEALQSNGANFYGFILNRLDLSATTNYYQYYYYSNDYYHNYHALENA